MSLKEYALKHFSSSRDASRKPLCHELGRSLGAWLLAFHRWATLPEQSQFREEVKLNSDMQQIKHYVNYEKLLEKVAEFFLENEKKTFQKVCKAAEKEMDLPDLQIVHGDFWTGK